MKKFNPVAGMTLICTSVYSLSSTDGMIHRINIGNTCHIREVVKVRSFDVDDKSKINVFLAFDKFDVCIGDAFRSGILFDVFTPVFKEEPEDEKQNAVRAGAVWS